MLIQNLFNENNRFGLTNEIIAIITEAMKKYGAKLEDSSIKKYKKIIKKTPLKKKPNCRFGGSSTSENFMF